MATLENNQNTLKLFSFSLPYLVYYFHFYVYNNCFYFHLAFKTTDGLVQQQYRGSQASPLAPQPMESRQQNPAAVTEFVNFLA